LDKTGTLTEGKPAVTDIVTLGVPEQTLLELAAAAQQGSEHPLARAVLARADGLDLAALDEFQSSPGRGLTARVGGQEIAVGNRRLMRDKGLAVEDTELRAARLEAQGKTVMWVAELDPSARLLGLIAVADPVKPTAHAAVQRLHNAGMATGVRSIVISCHYRQLDLTRKKQRAAVAVLTRYFPLHRTPPTSGYSPICRREFRKSSIGHYVVPSASTR
jgi:P-type E1-E2 ATPase